MKTFYLYKDTIHGIQAAAPSKSMAWALIRNECLERKIDVPTMDKIEKVIELTDKEVTELKQSKQ